MGCNAISFVFNMIAFGKSYGYRMGMANPSSMRLAAGSIPQPGTKLGPCAHTDHYGHLCIHMDCREMRETADAECVYCGKPIGYDTRYYRETEDSVRPLVNYSHARCAEEAAEAQ